MKTLIALLVLAVLGLAAGIGFLYSGIYNMAADEPHWMTTEKVLETLRERSIATRIGGLEVPADLSDAARVRRGAGNYDAMCAGCHLNPGVNESEIRKGLYPQPPNLSLNPAWHGHEHEHAGDPAAATRQFWIIKHGIKASGMPAWSRGGMDDGTIWDMVALLQKLPEFSPEAYAAAVAASEGHTHAGSADHHPDANNETPEAPKTQKKHEDGHEHSH